MYRSVTPRRIVRRYKEGDIILCRENKREYFEDKGICFVYVLEIKGIDAEYLVQLEEVDEFLEKWFRVFSLKELGFIRRFYYEHRKGCKVR